MEPLKNSIIGEFLDNEFVEALIPGNDSSLRVCIRVPIGADYPTRLRGRASQSRGCFKHGWLDENQLAGSVH